MCIFTVLGKPHGHSVSRYNAQALVNSDWYFSQQDSCHLYYPRSSDEWTLMPFSMGGWYAVTLGKGCHCRVIQAQRHKRTHVQHTAVWYCIYRYRSTEGHKSKCLYKGLGTNMEPLYRVWTEKDTFANGASTQVTMLYITGTGTCIHLLYTL